MDLHQFGDPIFIAKLINFVVFVGTIVFLYQRYGKRALVAYQEGQNKAVDDATRYRADCELAVKAAREAIDLAEADSVRMVEVGNTQAERLIAAERAAAEALAARMLAHAVGELDRERYRVRIELLEETVHRAHGAAQEIVRRELTPALQDALVRHAMNSVGGQRV